MINDVIAKALDDLLEHVNTSGKFLPRTGKSFSLQVAYGQSSNLINLGQFQAREYEHQFLCRAADIAEKTRGAHFEFNGQSFDIADVQIQWPAAIMYGD